MRRYAKNAATSSAEDAIAFGRRTDAARSWGSDKRRVVARVEASTLALDIRFVVTSLADGSAQRIYDILHRAAYWLMWKLREAIPTFTALRTAEFATLRTRLIKVAARVVETASRIRIAFASACPDASVFKAVAITLRMASA